MKSLFTILLSVIFVSAIYGQVDSSQVKSLEALRITEKIKIDGVINEAVWELADIATDFIQREPTPNVSPDQATEVKVIYDDQAIYVAATMYDTDPQSIMRQFSERDQLGSVDWFALILDTYRGGVDGVGFVVSAAGVQLDTKYSQQGEDTAWDAVWESEVKILEDRWIVEMRIPYFALRFPSNEVQEWGINFARQNRRIREKSWWSPLRPEINGFLNQAGVLKGIKDVKSPVRLSLTPYVTTYLNNNVTNFGQSNTGWGTAYNAGLDLKYGINDAFTLDMVLVPDFGQASSDQLILNLGPFEQFLGENRPFFTEGVEIFQKGNIFYSRRVGGAPINRINVFTKAPFGSVILDNPGQTQLYNATKISGRNSKGLGIGFFNAVEGQTNATIRTPDGEELTIETNPVTNYNVLVLDQNLPNNSSISFINTNVMRAGSTYDANVTALDYSLRTKDQKWLLEGNTAISQLYFNEITDVGHKFNAALSEVRGKFNYGINYSEESDNYNPNDLGFLFSPNERNIGGVVSWNEYDPRGVFNRYEFWMSPSYNRLYDPNVFTSFQIDAGTFAMTRKFFAFGSQFSIAPFGEDNYFEPRTSDFSKSYHLPSNWYVTPFISTDYNKQFALDLRYGLRKFDQDGRVTNEYTISPRYRFSDKFNMILRCQFYDLRADEGWVSKGLVDDQVMVLDDEDILFGRRDRFQTINTVSGEYTFTNKMSVSFRVRHYWDQVEYSDFGMLNDNGDLDIIDFDGNDASGNSTFDTNFNLFNIDLDYRWRFAPGSDLFFVWRQNLNSSDRDIESGYFNNFTNQFNQPQNNSFSLRMVYFLDYNSVFNRT